MALSKTLPDGIVATNYQRIRGIDIKKDQTAWQAMIHVAGYPDQDAAGNPSKTPIYREHYVGDPQIRAIGDRPIDEVVAEFKALAPDGTALDFVGFLSYRLAATLPDYEGAEII